MKIKTLDDLFLHELRDLHSAEKQLLKALPKMAKAASSEKLQKALQTHLKETETHVERLEKAFEELDASSRGKKCAAMEGLIEEGSELLEEDIEAEVLDAALIGAAQRVEHYEIAGYGTAAAFAQHLGHTKTQRLLEQTLEEEKAADVKLTKLALSEINLQANEA
jgi:ferritin-like metal-binding protein YciE